MSDPDVTARTRRFYEEHPFPGNRPLDRDGLIFLRHFTDSIICAREQGATRPRVLDAGCGTGNTTISLARHFPWVDFVGVDQSRTSLAQARASAAPHALPNLVFRRWNLAQPFSKAERYSIILCLGVLHHTADMAQVLAHLRRTLKRRGELYLWIYGKHGRYNHSLNVRLLSMLRETDPTPADPVEFARDFIHGTGRGAPVSDLLGAQPSGPMQAAVFDDPVWIADQFLNPHEKLLDMNDLLRLVSSTGFSVHRFLGLRDAPGELLSPALRERFQQLTHKQQWIALDLLLKPERYFVVLRKRGRKP